jgi:hypothetical protein
MYFAPSPLISTEQIFVGVDEFTQNTYRIGIDILDLGDLIGIATENPTSTPNFWTNPQTSQAMLNESNVRAPAIIRNNFGGGAIGSSSYLLLHIGHPYNYRADGAAKLPRRWTESMFKQFLCKEGPYVRESDAQNFLAIDSNAVPFRQTVACLRCHSTLDQSAMVARNIRLGMTINRPITIDRRFSSLVLQYNATRGYDNFWSASPVPDYHLSQPTGRVYFRDRNGNLIDRNISSINELGVALSENEDYYTCMAQKYFNYFTGIDINLEYLTAPQNTATLSESDVDYRDYVIGLGQELQSTGSLKKLIETIIKSGYYQYEQKNR